MTVAPVMPAVLKATVQDAPSLFEVMSCLSPVPQLGLEAQREIVRRVLEGPASELLVVHDGEGQVMSTATVTFKPKIGHSGLGQPGQVCELDEVITRPEYRGRGLSHYVLERAIDLARSQRCYKIILDCDGRNEKLIRFYESLGFRRSGQIQLRIDLEA